MSTQPSHHDAVFRRILGEPANAASQLRAVLPVELTDRLALQHLTRVSGSIVDTDLRWRHSDLLFTAPLDGNDAFIYILVEHQSRTDPLMPFRMLNYLASNFLLDDLSRLDLQELRDRPLTPSTRRLQGPRDVH